MAVKEKEQVERVWLVVGAALAALFLLRSAGMIFQGAVTGLGMFVGIWVIFQWFPTVKRILFSLGGIFDLAVSFGLPFVISNVLGIQGGTMLIATVACGLLFTFSVATKKLGGTGAAVIKTARFGLDEVKRNFHSLKEEFDGRTVEVGPRGPERCGDPGRGVQRPEEEQAPEGHRGSGRDPGHGTRELIPVGYQHEI